MFVPRRLDKFLRDSTSLSGPEIQEACLACRVAVTLPSGARNNRPETDSLIFEDDAITLDGARVLPKTTHHYLVFNKPRFVTTTAKDPKGRGCLEPVLAQLPKGVFAVGRLDRETSGALIFTDDGDFANALLQPDRHTSKRYWLWLDDELTDDDPRLQAFVDGVTTTLEHPPLRVTHVEIQARTANCTELLVTLQEGKNRHLRKMCHVLGLHLVQLHRKAIGEVTLNELPVGQWRPLSTAEVETLWSTAGGRASAAQIKITALTQLAQRARRSKVPLVRLEDWLERVATAPSPSSD